MAFIDEATECGQSILEDGNDNSNNEKKGPVMQELGQTGGFLASRFLVHLCFSIILTECFHFSLLRAGEIELSKVIKKGIPRALKTWTSRSHIACRRNCRPRSVDAAVELPSEGIIIHHM